MNLSSFLQSQSLSSITPINESNNHTIFQDNDFVYKAFLEHDKYDTELTMLKYVSKYKGFTEVVATMEYKPYKIIIFKKIHAQGIKYIWDTLDDKQKKSSISDIVTLIRTFHKASQQRYLFSDYNISEFVSNVMKCKESDFFDSLEEYITKYIHFSVLYAQEKRKGFCAIHNDIWIANILFDIKTLTSHIIDFECSAFAPFEFDLYRILIHYYYAMDEKVDTEIDFCKYLLKGFIAEYPTIISAISTSGYCLFCIRHFISQASKYQEPRYNHKSNMKMIKTIIGWIKPKKSLGYRCKLEVILGADIKLL